MPFPASQPTPPSWAISQQEWEEALELAERWKDVRSDESYGASGKNLGKLARALLHLKGCYDTVRAAYED
jgi:hypothetical protein